MFNYLLRDGKDIELLTNAEAYNPKALLRTKIFSQCLKFIYTVLKMRKIFLR